jgi:hypothetical protein
MGVINCNCHALIEQLQPVIRVAESSNPATEHSLNGVDFAHPKCEFVQHRSVTMVGIMT